MPVPEKHPYVGTAAIILRDGKALLGKRHSSHGAGDWSFPGGHLEFGESWEDCVTREVKEEVGLEVESIGPPIVTNDIFPKDDLHYVTLFFEVRCKPDEPKLMEPDKFEEWRWFDWDKLPDNIMVGIQNLIDSGYQPSK